MTLSSLRLPLWCLLFLALAFPAMAATPQTISFASIPDQLLGTSPLVLNATASSGLPVTYSLSGPATLSGNRVTVTGLGRVSISARQKGNATFEAATPVQVQFRVLQSQTLVFSVDSPVEFGPAISLSATASSGLPVKYTLISGPATLSGSTLTPTGIGTITVKAEQPGSTIYAVAPPVTQRLVVRRAAQTISFLPIANQTLGTDTLAISATASSGFPITYSIVAGPATIQGNEIKIAATSPVTISVVASQVGDANHSPASVRQNFKMLRPAMPADVTLPAIFGDHMVLQQGIPLPVWGTAPAGQRVIVRIAGKAGQTTADANGKWRVTLPALPPSSTPQTMTVRGIQIRTFSDVLVGDVWICGGMSNMYVPLSTSVGGKEATAAATDTLIHFFSIPRTTAVGPRADVDAKWVVCSPQTADAFSGLGYFFGQAIRASQGRPIGLINDCVGGTRVEAWASLSSLQQVDDPKTQELVADRLQLQAEYPQAMTTYPAELAAYNEALDYWNEHTGAAFAIEYRAWQIALKKAQQEGTPLPPEPFPDPREPEPPADPNGTKASPSSLFNGMVAPLIPYGITGVLWYEGSDYIHPSDLYAEVLNTLIADWRVRWGEGDFPFLSVQFQNNINKNNPTSDLFALLREGQLKSLGAPNVAMVVTIDVGDPNNVHSRDKFDIAMRLARAADYLAYGEDVIYSGPIYDSLRISGSNAVVTFRETGSGLKIGSAPYLAPGVQPLPTDRLLGFTIAGEDRKFLTADATIVGNTVVLSNAQVSKPVAVRYGWAQNPSCNLYNSEDLPASPFRTDDWPLP